jgi:hypothetical protein
MALSPRREFDKDSQSLDRAARREGNATGIESSRAPSSSLYRPKKVVPIDAPARACPFIRAGPGDKKKASFWVPTRSRRVHRRAL